MAPTICVAEFPIAGTTVNTYVRRRQRPQNIASVRRRPFALEQMLRPTETSLTSRENCPRELEHTNTIPNRSISDKKLQADMDESCRKFIVARRDLLNIVVRTITLVQRNYILQKRVNALRAETRRYLCSTLNNARNRCQERRLQVSHSEVENVLPFTEQVASTSSPLLNSDLIDENSHHEFAYTCNHNDNYNHINDDCSSNDNSEDSSRNGY